MFSTIMVPLDGSQIAERALESATYLAKLSGAKIALVRNQDVPESIVENPAKFPVIYEIFEKEGRNGEHYLEQTASAVRESGLEVTTHLVHGASAAESIRTAAVQQRADLIVVTSHGRSGISRFLLGSVAEKLARLAPCPVLIVGRPALTSP
ncbi:universal stress protein [bacterium]|nr:universal stress protein [bacterium]